MVVGWPTLNPVASRMLSNTQPERRSGATAELGRSGLITGAEEGEFLCLVAGATPAQVVKRLVELGFPVHAITREESTLEQFYLSLVKKTPPPA